MAPDTLRAGGTVVIEGEHLPNALGDIRLSLGGVPLQVTAASATRIEATIPATGFPCAAAATMPLHVQLAQTQFDTTATVSSATRVSLAPGQSASLLGATESRCIEITAPANAASDPHYVVAVVNTTPDPQAKAQVDLRGSMSGHDVAAAAWQSSPLPPETLPPDASGVKALPEPASAHAAYHTDLAPKGQALWPQRSASLRATRAEPRVGDTVQITALLNTCSQGHPVRARVVYAGTRAVILADLKSHISNRTTQAYEQLGKEYDQTIHPLLTSQIGNPLAMDQKMSGDGRITILFTPFVNDSAPGTAGYVSACNFYPRAAFAGSNQDEVIYARVASAHETPDDWRRAIRSTVVHEAKHLASFAERLASNQPFEDSWLEEATARIAEELYSRTFPGGGSWKGSAGFAGSVACELLQCDDRPLIMWKHFAGLYGYLQAVDALSPLAGPQGASSASYGSGWAFVRWVTDRHALDEGAWLKALVRGAHGTGMAALAHAAGRSQDVLLAQWSASLALDNLAADDIQGAELTSLQAAAPSWRVSDMMAGLAQVYPGAFDARPLKVRRQAFGDFRLANTSLPGFASSYVALEGAQHASQLVELGSGNGASPLRVVILRVR